MRTHNLLLAKNSFQHKGLITFLLVSDPYPTWPTKVADKIRTVGLDSEYLFDMGFNKAKTFILQRLIDVESQNDEAMLPIDYSSLKNWLIEHHVPFL